MSTVNSKFIVNLKGKDFVTYEGLLSRAHEIGLKSIEVSLIQMPDEENKMTAICHASVMGDNGEFYSDYGDANPGSVNSKIVPHIIRMASTRAKARALRDFTNIGITAIEELNASDLDSTDPPTLSQLNLIEKLAKQREVDIEFDSLDKRRASALIAQLSS